MALSLIAFPMLGMPVVYTLFVVAVVGLAVFLIAETRIAYPMLDLKLFRSRLFTLANLANLLNGVARGAVLFVLIFFLQGPYGQDPLTAGLMMAPFGLAFMIIGPISGYLSDRHGSRALATAGLLITAVALFGLSTVTSATPFWLLSIYMVLMGGGSGLFNSPNTNTVMSAVAPNQRGIAAGVRTMLANTVQMLSIAIAYPLVLSRIPEDVMFKVFLYGGGMNGAPEALHAFEQGLHQAFLLSFVITLIAAGASALQPSHRPADLAPAAAPAPQPLREQ
jgi:MFS family permease